MNLKGNAKMSTAEKIVKVALEHFSVYGYKGTSLSKIAKEVGIQKPSIYAHFKSKEDLFTTCLDDASIITFRHMEDFIKEHEHLPATEVLHKFLLQYENLTAEKPSEYFCMRFAYFPPEEIKDDAIKHANAFIDQIARNLESTFVRLAEEKSMPLARIKEAIMAYLCMFDGVMVEFLFGSQESFRERVDNAWAVYERGISN